MSTIPRRATATLTGLLALSGCAQPTHSAYPTTEYLTSGFTIRAADVSGLYPGTRRTLVLTVTNPDGFAIAVTDLWGSLDRVSRPDCRPSASNLMVQAHDGPALPLTVPPRSARAAGWIPLYMPNTVADACQRATFTISLHGTAKKVNRS